MAGTLGSSAAMIADAVHSLSDLLTDVVVVVFVGAELMANGVKSIISVIEGETIPGPGYIALIAAAASIIAKEILYQATVRVGRKTDSPVVIANAWHHISDALSSIGALLGIGGAIILGDKWTILNPIVSCCISIAIIIVAIKISLPSLAELLDTALPEDIEKEIISTASSVPGVKDIHENGSFCGQDVKFSCSVHKKGRFHGHALDFDLRCPRK